MSEKTVLDLYRCDTSIPRAEHYSHWTPDGTRWLSTEEFFARTAALAEALAGLGVGRRDRVMILSDNRPEWHMVDLAVLDLGAVDVPIYGTLTPDQVAYQAIDSGAKVAVVENAAQMAKLLEIRGRCPELLHLVQIEGDREPGVLALDDLLASGRVDGAGDRFWQRAAAVDEHDLMTIIYTSGTTGEPKGVMLTHHNLVQNVLGAAVNVPVRHDDLGLEFLPLCHVLERMVSYIYMWRSTCRAYCSVYHVGDLIARIQPTLFAGVPRFYEKLHKKILDAVAASPPVKRALFDWALGLGREASRARLSGREPSGLAGMQYRLADRLVLAKVREKLGGRLRYAISGGAELPLFINEFFHALGVYIVEGYGLTETSPVIAVNGASPDSIRLGTVGKPLAAVEVKLAEDGELLVRGPNVMKGYWNKPAETAEVFDQDGFFSTGDIAEIDDDGFVLIVDRKKDLIVTAGGKNVAPQPIESHLKRSPYVDAAVLVGDHRPFIVALISPSFEDLEQWAASQGLRWLTRTDLAALPEVDELYQAEIARVNSALARYEQIKHFRLLPLSLSLEEGHLTPTLKVKRRVVEKQFAELIDEMYQGA